MLDALWISLIGMGLVFAAILLLWGMMALLVRLTAEKAASAPAEDAAQGEAPLPAREGADGAVRALRQKAALAAVAAALALDAQQKARTNGAGARTGGLSPWQSANRAGQLQGKAGLTRKKVTQ